MSLIQWKTEYEVGIHQIDEQHKQLVSWINQFHEAMREGKSSQVAGDILQKLVDYTHYHFQTEESLLEQYSYPGYIAHKAKHQELIKQVKEFQDKLNKSPIGLSVPMMEFLKSWLLDHIKDADKQYSQFLQHKGVS